MYFNVIFLAEVLSSPPNTCVKKDENDMKGNFCGGHILL